MPSVVRSVPELRNRILNALPRQEYLRLARNLEPVQLKLGEQVSKAGKQMTHVYFPETAMISAVSTMEDGGTVEVGVIGREGMAGLPVFLHTEKASLDSLVQIPGKGTRISAESFRKNVTPEVALYRLLLRYTQAFLHLTAQSAACNRLHTLSQRCARWLLLSHDAIGDVDLLLTQEFLSEMLGVRRSGVTVAAGRLQRLGLIRYTRGKVRLLDLEGLKRVSCECYFTIRQEWEALFS